MPESRWEHGYCESVNGRLGRTLEWRAGLLAASGTGRYQKRAPRLQHNPPGLVAGIRVHSAEDHHAGWSRLRCWMARQDRPTLAGSEKLNS